MVQMEPQRCLGREPRGASASCHRKLDRSCAVDATIRPA